MLKTWWSVRERAKKHISLALLCVIGALILHAMIGLFYVVTPARLWRLPTALKNIPTQAMTVMDSAQLARLLARNRAHAPDVQRMQKVRAPAQAPLLSQMPKNIPAPLSAQQQALLQKIQEQKLAEQKLAQQASAHKIYRVGTSFDAPKTNKPLAPEAAGGLGGSKKEKTRDSAVRHDLEKTVQAQKQAEHVQQHTGQPPVSPKNSSSRVGKRESISTPPDSGAGRLTRTQSVQELERVLAPLGMQRKPSEPLSPMKGEGERSEQAGETGKAAGAEHVSDRGSDKAAKPSLLHNLSFLNDASMREAVRTHALSDADTPEGDGSGFGVGSGLGLGGPGGADAQYGDPKYLFYNRKVYQGLQQSMMIQMQQVTTVQMARLTHGLQAPTAVRFALDERGRVKDARVVRASGNYYYDTLALAIVKEASYPPIPRSFGMHTTYYTYSIILFDSGYAPDTVGVSPYIEGE